MRDRLTVVGVMLGLLVITAGCGKEGTGEAARDESSTVAATESPADTSPGDATTRKPIRCLDAAGLADVKEVEAGLWSGLHRGPAYTVVVHRLAKPAKAPFVVAGEYAETGSFKVVAQGRGLTSQEGIEADASVQIVADCLGR